MYLVKKIFLCKLLFTSAFTKPNTDLESIFEVYTEIHYMVIL